jgi:hypothetical protein
MIKLEWTENRPPRNGVCRYDHCIAETPFGRFLLTWKGWKTDWQYDLGFDETPWDGIEYHSWGSIDEAKQWAADEMEKRIRLFLGEQPVPQHTLDALNAAADLNNWDEPHWTNASQAIVSEAQLLAIKSASTLAFKALELLEPIELKAPVATDIEHGTVYVHIASSFLKSETFDTPPITCGFGKTVDVGSTSAPRIPLPLRLLTDTVRTKFYIGQDHHGHEIAMIPPSVWRSVRANVLELVTLSERAPCKPLCELCVKRGYTDCANVAQTTPIPT